MIDDVPSQLSWSLADNGGSGDGKARMGARAQGLAEKWVEEMGYRELVTFHSTDAAGLGVYHTNVMMAIGSDVAVACLEAVANPQERQHLLASLRRHHEVPPPLR